jgi:hypothetical protein
VIIMGTTAKPVNSLAQKLSAEDMRRIRIEHAKKLKWRTFDAEWRHRWAILLLSEETLETKFFDLLIGFFPKRGDGISPPIELLAAISGRQPRAVMNHTTKLHKTRWLPRTPGRGRGITTVYTLAIPKKTEEELASLLGIKVQSQAAKGTEKVQPNAPFETENMQQDAPFNGKRCISTTEKVQQDAHPLFFFKKEERESLSALAPDEVIVNCASISWPGGVLNFSDLDLAAKRRKLDEETARQLAETLIRGWAKSGKEPPADPIKAIMEAVKVATKETGGTSDDRGTFLPQNMKLPEGWMADAIAEGLSPAQAKAEWKLFHLHYTNLDLEWFKRRSKDWRHKWKMWIARGRKPQAAAPRTASYFNFDDGIER